MTRGYSLGWRLLYSPPAVLESARVAFIGLNPGGATRPPEYAEFAMQRGSAYVTESWGAPPGTSKLQRQVRALFQMIGEDPDRVLAGNLVPFRSPSWEALPNRDSALQFGTRIWREILNEVRPQLVIAMGGATSDALNGLLNSKRPQRISVGWGNIAGERSEFDRGVLVGLPHLSRFGICTRPESAAGLRALLRP